MRIHIRHETIYSYEQPVRGAIQLLRLTPRDHEGQHVRAWRIETDTDGRLKRDEDPLGNILHRLAVEGPVERIRLRVAGEVETAETHGVVRGAVERLPDPFYLRESSLAKADAAIRAFALEATGDRTRDPLGAVHRLLSAVHRHVAFDTQPTQSATTA